MSIMWCIHKDHSVHNGHACVPDTRMNDAYVRFVMSIMSYLYIVSALIESGHRVHIIAIRARGESNNPDMG